MTCCSWLCSPWFWLADVLLGLLLIEFALFKTKSIRRVDEARDSKYPAFRRNDTQYWTRPRLYLAAPVVLPRFFLALSSMAVAVGLIQVLLIGLPAGTRAAGFRLLTMRFLTKAAARWMLFFGGGMITYTLERPKADYSAYLGPDWKASYGTTSTIVANHQSWADILLITILKFPSFTPKVEIKKWPLFGKASDIVFNSYFINRAGTPEEREKIVIDLCKRQEELEKGDAPPLIMFPEGCTTNNTQLIQFRRGAFFGLHSVQPFTFRYYSPYVSLPHDILNPVAHMILCCCQPYSTAVVKELPVFKPNEFFFKNH